jgi:hypothetical protein
MVTTPAEASALWRVAVATTLVTKKTAKMAAKATQVRRALKARMTDTHVFYAARCKKRTAAAISAFLPAYIMQWIT